MNFLAVLSSFVLAFFLMSCTSPSSSALKEIVIDPSQTLGFYDLAEDVEPEFDIFALETTDSCLVGAICRIIYTNDLYYILDYNSVISIFNPQGKFVSKLDKIGRAPDEYGNIRDFTVVGENIWIYDEMRLKLSCYDKNLDKIEDVKTNTIINKIACVGENIYGAGVWFGFDKENFQIIEYNTLNKEMKKLMPYPQNYDPNKSIEVPYIHIINQLAPLADSCLFVQPYCDTLFQLAHGTVIPRYKYRFTERFINKRLTGDESKEEYKKSMIIGVSAIYQTPASILILYAEPEYKYAIYNKETGITNVYYIQFVNSYLGNLGTIPKEFTNNREIIAIYSAADPEQSSFIKDRVKNPGDRQKIENVFAGLTEDSNPVVLKYKLKKNSKL